MSMRWYFVVTLALAGCHAALPSSAEQARVVTVTKPNVSVQVRRGDTLVIVPAMTADDWHLEFDEEFLRAAGAADSLRHPDAAGWKFTVLAIGETTLTASPVLQGGANPPRFEYTITSER
jgi:hypothetical protein